MCCLQISVDWAGVMVERVTGLKLNDYMQQYIFTPLKINNLSMLPSPEMKSRFLGLWQRDANGQLSRRKCPLSKPLHGEVAADMFHSGGAGLFGSIRDLSSRITSKANSQYSYLSDIVLIFHFGRDSCRTTQRRDITYDRQDNTFASIGKGNGHQSTSTAPQFCSASSTCRQA